MAPSILGTLYIVLAFFFVALMGAISKHTPQIQLTTLVFFQSFIALILVLPWALQGGLPGLKTERLALHFLRAMGGLASQFLMLLSVRRMPLLGATLLANAAPIFISLLAWACLHQRPTRMHWLGLSLGFIGILCVLKPGFGLFHTPASAAALASALCSAGVLLTVEQLSRTERPQQILFYYFLFSSLVIGPFAAFAWQAPAAKDWVPLLAIGVCMGVAQLLIVLAYGNAPASQLSPFNYSVVIFSGILGRILWRDPIDILDGLGTILVMSGGIVSMRSHQIVIRKKQQGDRPCVS